LEAIYRKHLTQPSGVSTNTISKLSKNEKISMDSMLKMCRVLNCDRGDIVEMVEADDAPDS
jgi:DNA-binding Xre family transcriptional regulator